MHCFVFLFFPEAMYNVDVLQLAVLRLALGVVAFFCVGSWVETMNAPYFSGFPQAAPQPDVGDEQLTQVREILVGDFSRDTCSRLAHMEQRLAQMELHFAERVEALETKVELLASQVRGDRSALETALSHRFQTLDEQVNGKVSDLSGRIEVLTGRLDTLAAAVEEGRRAAFDALSQGISALGSHIKNIAKP
jgi:phage host-nuclease inhibitor protein Gam